MKKIYILFVISFFLPVSSVKSQVYGCTDKLAANYNSSATINDGSCLYNTASVTPASSFSLGSNLSETSGLITWNNQVWTHNDNNDIHVYALDTINGSLVKSYPLTGTVNKDWEEISQDSGYIYVGDFGNNQNGNRTDLKILRVEKSTLLLDSPSIDTISFSYSNQADLNPAGTNNTDFDCEAFVVTADSIYLFTKQWVSNKSSLYSLSKAPGTHVAKYRSSLNVQGLITGAVYLEPKKLIVLCGYSSLLEPFLYLLYDFKGSDFFGGNKRKITVSLPFHQVEGIATMNGLKYYISNESFSQLPYINNPQKLHILDMRPFLESYFNTLLVDISETKTKNELMIYPVPASSEIRIKSSDDLSRGNYFITNYAGQTVLSGQLPGENHSIDVSGLPVGMYILKIGRYSRLLYIKPIIVIR